MPTRIDTLYYDIEAVDSQFRGGIGQDAKALQGLERAGASARIPLGALDTAMQTSARSAGTLERGFVGAERAANQLATLVKSFGILLGLSKLREYADGWVLMSARISLVTDSTAELNQVQAKLFQLSQETRQDLGATVDLYARMARSTKQLGLTQQDLLTITRAVNQAFVVSGATGVEASQAMIQLGQALASGTLRGDELRSVLEQAPRLAQAIATGMGTTIGQLRVLGAQGKLTSKEIADAILSQAAKINEEFGHFPLTIAQGFTLVSNSVQKFVGETSEATAAGRTLAGTLRTVAEHMAGIANAALTLTAIGVARWFGGVGTTITEFVVRQRAAAAATKAMEAAAIQEALARKGEAAAALETARATQAATAAKVADIQATRAAILASRELAVANLQAAQATLASPTARVPIANLAPLGGAAVEREMARRAAATRAASAATKEMATLGAQQARVEAELAAATAASAAAQRSTALATTAAARATVGATAAMEGMTLGARVAAGAVGLLRGALSLLGGWVGVGILAIAGAFAVLSHNAQAAREEAEKFKESMHGLSPREYGAIVADLEAKIAHATDVLNGVTPDTDAKGNRRPLTGGRVRELQQSIVEWRKNLAVIQELAKETAAATGGGGGGGDNGNAQKIADLQQRVADMIAQGKTTTELGKLRLELQKLLGEAEKAGLAGSALDEFKAKLEEVYNLSKQKVGESLVEQIRAQLAQLTPTLVDDMKREMEKLEALRPQLVEAGATPDQLAEFDRLKQMREQLIEVQKQAEDVDALITQIGREPAGATAYEFIALDAKQRTLEALKEEAKSDAVIKAIEKEILKIERERKQLADDRSKKDKKDKKDAQDAKGDRDEATRKVRAQAQAIRDAVNGALELGRAFGIVSDETARTLTNIGNIAAGIGPLSDAIKGGGFGSILGAALPVAGGLSGLVTSMLAESPEEKLRREQIAANTRALENLTTHIGDLINTTVTGSSLSAARDIFSDPGIADRLSRNDLDFQPNREQRKKLKADIYARFAAQGFSIEDVQKLAEQFDIKLGDSIETWQQFAEAVQKADLNAYLDSYAGSLQQLHDSFEVYDITDPVERLRKTVQVLGGANGIPAIAKVFQGLDVGNAEDREKALERLQQLFEDLSNAKLSAADFGAATIDEARQQILDTIQGIRDAAQNGTATGPSGTGGFNVSREITEATGSRIGGLLTSANVWAQQTAANTAIIARALTGASAPIQPIPPPAVPASTVPAPIATDGAASGGGGGDTYDITLELNFEAGSLVGSNDPTEIGRRIADPLLEAIDRGMGQRNIVRRHSRGDVVIPQ